MWHKNWVCFLNVLVDWASCKVSIFSAICFSNDSMIFLYSSRGCDSPSTRGYRLGYTLGPSRSDLEIPKPTVVEMVFVCSRIFRTNKYIGIYLPSFGDIPVSAVQKFLTKFFSYENSQLQMNLQISSKLMSVLALLCLRVERIPCRGFDSPWPRTVIVQVWIYIEFFSLVFRDLRTECPGEVLCCSRLQKNVVASRLCFEARRFHSLSFDCHGQSILRIYRVYW